MANPAFNSSALVPVPHFSFSGSISVSADLCASWQDPDG